MSYLDQGITPYSMCQEGQGIIIIAVEGLPFLSCDMVSEHQNRFKENLDAWLYEIPDQPNIYDYVRAGSSNSLLYQVTSSYYKALIKKHTF